MLKRPRPSRGTEPSRSTSRRRLPSSCSGKDEGAAQQPGVDGGQHGAPVGLSLLEGASERVFAGKLERAEFTEVWVGRHRPFGTDQAALYPLFTPEVIQVMRRTIPPAIRAMWPPG